MGTTTKRRQQSKRKATSNTTTTTKTTNTRQAAVSFLSNITLGNEHELKPTTTSIASITESPTLNYQLIQNNNVTQYGTLSVSTNDNAAAKGISFESSHTKSPTIKDSKEQQVPISLKIDTRRRSNSILSTSNKTPITSTAEKRRLRRESTSDSFFNHRRFSSDSSSGSNSSEVYKLTREDSERPIASEKVKKKSDHTTPTTSHYHHHQDTAGAKNNDATAGSMSFMSVFRYYKGIIRQPRRRSEYYHHHNHRIHYHSYFHQHLANMHQKHCKALSYGHFLSTPPSEQLVPNSNSNSSSDEAVLVNPTSLALCDHILEEQTIVDTISSSSAYDPLYLDDESTLEKSSNNYMDSSQGSLGDSIHINRYPMSSKKKELLNQEFRKSHPDLPAEITLSKINAVKFHLVNIGKAMDLEISSVSHAFVYFEKLIHKQIVNKQNRKLLAACCLFLATKVNEPKGSWFKALLEAIHSELGVNSKDVRNHEFAVFADLEFNLYVPISEFMHHFNKICGALEIQCIEDYLGNEPFYKLMEGGCEIVEAPADGETPFSTAA